MDSLSFDFEALQPPLPYATSGQGSGAGGRGGRGGAPSAFAGREKKTLALKDVVCRYWYKGRCMKEEKCEFLHQV